jgi:hypothetical protein
MLVPSVIIVVRGGVVQDVLCDEDIKVRLIDFDGDDEEENDRLAMALDEACGTHESQVIE